VAIIMESSTQIENLLKDALKEEGFQFKEQYMIYEKSGDLYPKYVVDFLIKYRDKSVIVECDGSTYHSSDFDIVQGIRRDCWLEQQGYGKVLHFTTFQLRYEMETVILNIKHRLGIGNTPKAKLRFKKKKVNKNFVINKRDENLHKVTLYYSCIQVKDWVWVVYKYQDNTLGRFSEERVKIFYNVPEKQGNALAVYVALKDLKRCVELTVYCPSEWLTGRLNQIISVSQGSDILIAGIAEILKRHNYLFKYINMYRDVSYYENPSHERFVMQELRSRCRQIHHGKAECRQNNGIDFACVSKELNEKF